MFYELAGFIGSILFAISSWPQAYYTIKTRDTSGVSAGFITLMFIGGFASSIYAFMTGQYMLLPNFICGAAGIGVVGIYKILNWRRG